MGQGLFSNPQQRIADAIQLAFALEKQGGGLTFKALLTKQLPAQLALRTANEILLREPLGFAATAAQPVATSAGGTPQTTARLAAFARR